MEYLEGINLDTLVESLWAAARRPRHSHSAAGLWLAGRGARIGLVHRDIKPANIVLGCRGGESDFVKVLDFGLVKAVDSKKEASLTSAGAVIGTPLYMSPEAVESPDRVDGRSDLYARRLRRLFPADRRPAVRRQERDRNLHAPFADAADRVPASGLSGAVSAELEAVLLKGLAKDPHDRFQTAREFRRRAGRLLCCGQLERPQADAWWSRIAAASVPSAPVTAAVAQAATVVLEEGVHAS